MQAFNIKGGPMYTITKTSHYAYREMVFQDIIQGRVDPGMKVSGEQLLFLVNRVLYRMDDNPWVLPPSPILPSIEIFTSAETFAEETISEEEE
jgi:hypothetical protein